METKKRGFLSDLEYYYIHACILVVLLEETCPIENAKGGNVYTCVSVCMKIDTSLYKGYGNK